MNRICKNCGEKIKRIRQRWTYYESFCSIDCSKKYHETIGKLIEEKEKELSKLRREFEETKVNSH